MIVEHIRARSTPEGSEGLLAILLQRREEWKTPEGVNFVTPPELSQQVAIISHPAGYVVPAHTHVEVKREVRNTRETIIMFKGKLMARLFNSKGEWECNRLLFPGDVLILIAGGHGFIAESDVEFYEVKQGPYSPGSDKVPIDDPLG